MIRINIAIISSRSKNRFDCGAERGVRNKTRLFHDESRLRTNADSDIPHSAFRTLKITNHYTSPRSKLFPSRRNAGQRRLCRPSRPRSSPGMRPQFPIGLPGHRVDRHFAEVNLCQFLVLIQVARLGRVRVNAAAALDVQAPLPNPDTLYQRIEVRRITEPSVSKIVQSSTTTRLRGSVGTRAPIRPPCVGLPLENAPVLQAPMVSRLNSSIAFRTSRRVSRSRSSRCRSLRSARAGSFPLSGSREP